MRVKPGLQSAKVQKNSPRVESFSYPRPGSNRHGFKGQGILSPSCLPIPPLRHLHKKSRTASGPCGAENETRTRDPDLGKVVLYQLSYFRLSVTIGNPFCGISACELRGKNTTFFVRASNFYENFVFILLIC